MEILDLPEERALLCLRALRAIAAADGKLAAQEARLLGVAAGALRLVRDPSTLEPATPDEVAAGVTDPLERLRLLQGLIVMAMIDGDVDRTELAALRAFADALGLDEPRLANLRQYAAGRWTMMRWDLMRRSGVAQVVVSEAWSEEGWRGVYRVLGPTWGRAAEPEIAWRYKELGLLSEGTLGRTYWAHMTRRHFPFPGEPGGFAERLVKHDLAHVLGGYDTDPEGEVEAACFIAGFMRRDPFWEVFMLLMQFHLGVDVFGQHDAARGRFDIARAAAALGRGMRTKVDLYDAWTPWPHFARPLADVRAELGIDPDANVV